MLIRRGWGLVLAAALFGAAACSSRPPAPIIDRSEVPPRAEMPVDGLYRVRRGDTLYAIAFKHGLDYRDVAAWNGIRSPYVIYPDQVLRLKPHPRPEPRIAERRQAEPAEPVAEAPEKPGPAAPEAGAPPPDPMPRPVTAGPDPEHWKWPLQGRLLRTFKSGDPARNGLDIAAPEGQPVRASAAGEVVYSGSGLIGYGELIIVKHSDRMLSAYAHNRRRMVSEGERVAQGQQIAESGRNDRDEALLHFEIRANGTPVDPLNYLPPR